jgi:hypothetical protein
MFVRCGRRHFGWSMFAAVVAMMIHRPVVAFFAQKNTKSETKWPGQKLVRVLSAGCGW